MRINKKCENTWCVQSNIMLCAACGLIIKGIPALTNKGELVLEVKDLWQNVIESFRINIDQIEILSHHFNWHLNRDSGN